MIWLLTQVGVTSKIFLHHHKYFYNFFHTNINKRFLIPFLYQTEPMKGTVSVFLSLNCSSFDQKLEEKYAEMVPPVYEMEKILAKRKDPAERVKVLTFYDVLLQNIADELDGIRRFTFLPKPSLVLFYC